MKLRDVMAAMQKAPAVHTSKREPSQWYVELGEKGVWIRLVTGEGKMLEFCMAADQAARMAGALHQAAQERRRMTVMQKGEHVGPVR